MGVAFFTHEDTCFWSLGEIRMHRKGGILAVKYADQTIGNPLSRSKRQVVLCSRNSRPLYALNVIPLTLILHSVKLLE